MLSFSLPFGICHYYLTVILMTFKEEENEHVQSVLSLILTPLTSIRFTLLKMLLTITIGSLNFILYAK